MKIAVLSLFVVTLLSPIAHAKKVVIEGRVQTIVEDDFQNKKEKITKVLITKDKKRYELKSNKPSFTAPNEKVRVEGNLNGQVLDAESIVNLGGLETSSLTEQAAYMRRTLVVYADFVDATASCSSAGSIVANQANHYFQTVSRGRIGFATPQSVRVRIAASITETNCDVSKWVSLAEAEAAKSFDLSQFEHAMYIVPSNVTGCGWGGIASVGYRDSAIRQCHEHVITHELGHNLGMYHASTSTNAYGDASDIMGSTWAEVNAPHSLQMGWTPWDKVLKVTQSGVYTLSTHDMDARNSSLPTMMYIHKSDYATENTSYKYSEFYSFSLRSAVAPYNSSLSTTYLNKLNVHSSRIQYRKDTGAVVNTDETYFLGGYSVGGEWRDDNLGVIVKPLSFTADTVTVEVNVNGSCIRRAPLVTYSPTSQNGSAVGSVGYMMTVKNMDNIYCPPQDISIAGGSMPAGFSISSSSSFSQLAPGVSRTTILEVRSSNSSASGTNIINIIATALGSGLSSQSSVSYVILGACISSNASLSVSPVSQNGPSVGSLSYSLSVRNNDSASCVARSFRLEAGNLPSGFSASFSSSNLSLSAGASSSAIVTLNSNGSSVNEVNTAVINLINANSVVEDSKSISYIIDKTAPSQPMNLVGSSSNGTVSLSWSASIDSASAVSYQLYRNGVYVENSSSAFYSERLASGTYSYYVIAVDGAGNRSQASNSVSVSVAKKGGKPSSRK